MRVAVADLEDILPQPRQAIAAIDLFVVPTLTFERLFAFLVLSHDRRQLLWFEVTRHLSLLKTRFERNRTNLVRIASSLRADMIFGKDRS